MNKFLVVIIGVAGIMKGFCGDWQYAIQAMAMLCCIGAMAKSDEVIKQQDALIKILRSRLMQ